MKNLLLLTTWLLAVAAAPFAFGTSVGDECDSATFVEEAASGGRIVCRNNRKVFVETSSGEQQPINGSRPNPGSNNNTTTNNTTTTTATESQIQAVNQAIEACQTAAESTVGSCATDRNGTMANVLDGADALANGLGQMTAAAGTGTTAETCQTMANAAGAANAAMGAIKANCLISYNSCSSSCKEAEDAIKKEIPAGERSQYTSQLSPHKTKCNSAQTRIRSLDQNIANAMRAYQRSQTCMQDTTGTTMPTLAQCMANPSLPNCSLVLPQDCTNPQVAASNLACICQASNGRDSRCGQANLGSTSPNQGASTSDKSSVNDGTLGMPSLDAFGTKNPYEAPAIEPTRKADLQLPSSPGGGGGGGGGRGANEPKPRQAAYYPSRISVDVNKGFVGGSGGAGAFGKSTASGGGSVGKDGGWIPPKVAPNPNAINFDRFRPSDANFANRGLASNDVLPNGLLAPHVNIWKQVNSRYLKIMSTLTP